MTYALLYHPDVAARDLPPIARDMQERIRRAIEHRLTSEPARYGKPLRYSLKALWSLRVGDYRIVYTVRAREVVILKIGHRRDVYKSLGPRITSIIKL